MKVRVWSAALAVPLCIAGASGASAQQSKPVEPSPSSMQVQSKLVVVPTIVRDHKGVLVNGLKKEDFALQVDGQAQAIRYFDHENDVPLTLGLLVDVSPSQRKALGDERTGSQAFLDTMLAPAAGSQVQDNAFVVQFAKQVELLQDVTDVKPRLQNALKELGTESASFHTTDQSTQDTDREGRRIEHGGTALYDAIFLSTDEVTSKQAARRRALVVVTDGVDRGSKESLTDAIESAQRADTIVYGIYYKGETPRQEYRDDRAGQRGSYPGRYPGGGYPGGGYPGGGYPGGYPQGGGTPRDGGGEHRPYVDGKKTLERICGETGGRVFEVSKKEPIEEIYRQIGEELRSQYRLGFTPSGDAAKDKYHQITLTLTGDAAKNKPDVQTRDGYYFTQN